MAPGGSQPPRSPEGMRVVQNASGARVNLAPPRGRLQTFPLGGPERPFPGSNFPARFNPESAWIFSSKKHPENPRKIAFSSRFTI